MSSSSPITNYADDDMQDIIFTKRGCLFWIPCFRSKASSSAYGRRCGEEQKSEKKQHSRPKKLKKVKELSKKVFGSKWKKFIRRLKKKNVPRTTLLKKGSFHYDPLSYSLNFDDGKHYEGDDHERYSRNFSYRFASLPASTKSSMDLGNGKDNSLSLM
ncbi:hypothetical protein HN51_041656 [Arachis hypogaea]|uniref:uncharacterized protein LOC110263555 n=1 Tax=Arachis ipaensis TaxID=130454 RepID=UPI000A2AFB26|nr:uncharacterized protein LOC110263555 [Arachis ipaensis]XP_029149725.1 uncharacterized protein LOC112757676 [Arachis hypogaea]